MDGRGVAQRPRDATASRPGPRPTDELVAVLDRWMTECSDDQPAEGTELVLSSPTWCPSRSGPRDRTQDRPLGHPPAGGPHRAALAAGRPRDADHRAARPGTQGSPSPRSVCCSPCTAWWSWRSSCRPAGWPTCSAAARSSSSAPLLHLVSCVVFATATQLPRLPGRRSLLLGAGPGAGLRPGRGLVRRHRPPHRPDGRRRARSVQALGGRRRQPRDRRRSSAASCPALLGGAGARGARAAVPRAPPRSTWCSSSAVVAAADRGPPAARGQRPRRRSRPGCPGDAGDGGRERCGCRSPTGRCAWCCC